MGKSGQIQLFRSRLSILGQPPRHLSIQQWGHYASVSGIVTRCQRAIEINITWANTINDIADNIKAKTLPLYN